MSRCELKCVNRPSRQSSELIFAPLESSHYKKAKTSKKLCRNQLGSLSNFSRRNQKNIFGKVTPKECEVRGRVRRGDSCDARMPGAERAALYVVSAPGIVRPKRSKPQRWLVRPTLNCRCGGSSQPFTVPNHRAIAASAPQD